MMTVALRGSSSVAAEELAAENERRANLGHGAQFLRDRAGDAIGVFEPRSGRQLDRQERAAVVVRRNESRRQQLRRPQGSGENQSAREQGQPAVAHGSAHEPRIEAHDRAVPLRMLMRRAQEIGGDHRRDETRDEQREHDGDRDRQAELTEILAGDAAHEAHRREDRGDRERDGDDREPDLVGRLERSAIGRLAHAHMADDVLDLDDRVVDQNAGHERDREQAHEVEREADRVHRPEGRNDRKRQRDRGDERGAQIAQEDEHDDDGEQRALDQRLHGRMIIADLAVDLGVDLGEFHLRMRGLDFLQPLRDQSIDASRRLRPWRGSRRRRRSARRTGG